MQFNSPPNNEQELLLRCQKIAGKTLAELGSTYNQTAPKSLTHSKGWIGQLIENHLGAYASNLPIPDFANLGIELKTIPINAKGEPQESTYICTAPLSMQARQETWINSRVWQKMKRMLLVPVEACPRIPVQNRRIGSAILWTPDHATEKQLKEDWEELMEMLLLGKIGKLSGHFGTYLQIRPKAMHSRILQITQDEQGEAILAGPKGFYMRSMLTKKILAEHYC